MIMQVHDELVFEVADADCDTLCETVPRIMSEVISLDVPLVADVGTGLNWDEAH
ncbi:MAG: DNA polymerase [Luminiphilus sp.]